MKNRLFIEGWATTILGIGVLCCSVYMHVSPNYTTMEAGALDAIGLLLLRAKNSLIDLRPKNENTPISKK